MQTLWVSCKDILVCLRTYWSLLRTYWSLCMKYGSLFILPFHFWGCHASWDCVILFLQLRNRIVRDNVDGRRVGERHACWIVTHVEIAYMHVARMQCKLSFVQICIHVYTYIHIYVYIYMYIYICDTMLRLWRKLRFIQRYICIYIYSCICICTLHERRKVRWKWEAQVETYTSIYIYIHTHTHTHTHIYI